MAIGGVGNIIGDANIKEFVAVIGGNVLGNLFDGIAKDMDKNQRDGLKVATGLGGSYFANNYVSGKAREAAESELVSLSGLALTAMAAQAPSQRVNIEVSKKLGKPVVVGSRRSVSTGSRPGARTAPKQSTPKQSTGGNKVVGRGTEPAERKKRFVTTGR